MSELELYNKRHLIQQLFYEHNVESIIDSPKHQHYRNKINLSFGLYNGMIEVGTLQKDFTVLPANQNNKCSMIAIKICEFIRDWVRSESKLKIVNNQDYSGFWRHITIHNNRLNHIMIILHLQNLEFEYKDTWELELCDLKFKLAKFIEQNNYFLYSIYIQHSNSKKETRNTDPYYLVYGDIGFVEVLDNYKFGISPGSFFQVNSETAEIIYQKVYELSELSENKIVLDLCCGTGTIGTYLAKGCKKVYGIDCSESNIRDANKNRYINQATNQTFYCGKVEFVVPKIKMMINDEDVIAIINPPRKGLEKKMALFLKSYSMIKQIIYISCNPNTLKRDMDIMNFSNDQIKNIIPVNQFPESNHCEVIVNIKK
jgi:23S rRNA (uracil1939-C5)-methyltransferase